MASFTTRNDSTEAVSAPIEDVWAAMSDPDLLARLTPLVARIDVDGDRWTWCLAGVEALGVSVSPCMTVAMTMDEPVRIGFRHDPPDGEVERAGVDGSYRLEPFEHGTVLDIELEMCVDLPLPALSRGAVERVMARTTQAAGDRFFANLLDHLDASRRPVPSAV